MYDYASMMVIYRQEKIAGLGLGLEVLGRSSSEIIVTKKILRRLVFFYKFDWKVIDLVA